MSGLDIEGVLSAHDLAGWRETRAENEADGIAALYRPECSCGELLDARDRVGSHRAHVAAILRDQIATAAGEPLDCGAMYGSNPDGCYHEAGHRGPHSNRWDTTWV